MSKRKHLFYLLYGDMTCKHLLISLICLSVILSSCSNGDTEVNTIVEPRILSFSIFASDNADKIVADSYGEVIGDSIIDVWIRNICKDKKFRFRINYEGEKFLLDGQIVSKEDEYDFSKEVVLQILNGNMSKYYTINVHRYTGLPILWIETENRQEIESKEEYIKASFRLEEDLFTRSAGQIVEEEVKIKGRGNRNWEAPKKSYRLKFYNKVSLLDEPEDKSWILLGNYDDKTMLRHKTAYWLGNISCLSYTPRFHYVELMLNGRYWGTYLLGDKLKVSESRVNVGDDGYLLEEDGYAEMENDVLCFKVNHLRRPLSIKDGSKDLKFIRDYVTKADSILFSNDFRNPKEGWQKYFDLDTFVDWYLIQEIAKNVDVVFASTYMNFSRIEGGKIKMGPLWDFDQAFCAGWASSPDGFWVKELSEWFQRLMEDPVFIAKVKDRYNYFFDRRYELMQYINDTASYLQNTVEENDKKWNVLYEDIWRNYDVLGSYQNEVQSMKDWILFRMNWLKNEFDKM